MEEVVSSPSLASPLPLCTVAHTGAIVWTVRVLLSSPTISRQSISPIIDRFRGFLAKSRSLAMFRGGKSKEIFWFVSFDDKRLWGRLTAQITYSTPPKTSFHAQRGFSNVTQALFLQKLFFIFSLEAGRNWLFLTWYVHLAGRKPNACQVFVPIRLIFPPANELTKSSV